MKNKLKWDDALDVWGVHGVGGLIGIILLGLFANPAVNKSGLMMSNGTILSGLFFGNGGNFFLRELIAILISSIYAFLFTYGVLWLINKIKPVRVSEKDEAQLDEALHGEQAYDNTI